MNSSAPQFLRSLNSFNDLYVGVWYSSALVNLTLGESVLITASSALSGCSLNKAKTDEKQKNVSSTNEDTANKDTSDVNSSNSKKNDDVNKSNNKNSSKEDKINQIADELCNLDAGSSGGYLKSIKMFKTLIDNSDLLVSNEYFSKTVILRKYNQLKNKSVYKDSAKVLKDISYNYLNNYKKFSQDAKEANVFIAESAVSKAQLDTILQIVDIGIKEENTTPYSNQNTQTANKIDGILSEVTNLDAGSAGGRMKSIAVFSSLVKNADFLISNDSLARKIMSNKYRNINNKIAYKDAVKSLKEIAHEYMNNYDQFSKEANDAGVYIAEGAASNSQINEVISIVSK